MKKRSQMYFFTSDEDEFVIFARSKLRAQAMFEAVRPPDVVMPPGFGGMDIEHWRLFGDEAQTEQICRGGWEGIGIPYADKNCWIVLPMPRGVW